MIVKLLFSLIITLLDLVFGWVSFPAMPAAVTESLDLLIDYISQGLSFVWLIVPRQLVIAVIPVILVCENFDKLYSVVMWVLKKIPFLGLQ